MVSLSGFVNIAAGITVIFFLVEKVSSLSNKANPRHYRDPVRFSPSEQVLFGGSYSEGEAALFGSSYAFTGGVVYPSSSSSLSKNTVKNNNERSTKPYTRTQYPPAFSQEQNQYDH